jgi:hypothetical protein
LLIYENLFIHVFIFFIHIFTLFICGWSTNETRKYGTDVGHQLLQGLRRRAQSRRYGRRCLAGVLGRELAAEYEIAAPSRRDSRVPPADEIAARPRAEEKGVNVGKNGRS